ncbi:hypothetical protein QP516_08270 [Micrococcus luteus]|uniref:hypothetical protein n=1 Tax=Micrococcus luteus TaxID=1270 RepID=UPI000C7ACB93|nr:hypothetical protein [Micrococcus luteus]MDK7329773.1 hypothetical protein [Micrococcus luteus]PLA41677.1 hypothetical protein CYJ94_09865 [Micrococcus luteus]
MHELTAADRPSAALDPGLTVSVHLPPRYKAGKPSHWFKYEQQRLRELGGIYHPDLRAWTVPDPARHLPQLAYLLERTQAILYAADTADRPTPDAF